MRTQIGYKGTPLLISTMPMGDNKYETAIYKYIMEPYLAYLVMNVPIYHNKINEKETFLQEPYFEMRHNSKEEAEKWHKIISQDIKDNAINYTVSAYMTF